MDHKLTCGRFWATVENPSNGSIPVFTGYDDAVDRERFRRACLGVAHQIEARGWQTVALHTRDSVGFAAGLFGIVLAGATPEVLPHAQPGFVAGLAGEINGLLTDYPMGSVPPGVPAIVMNAAEDEIDTRVWPDDPWISFRTSGSSGVPKRVTKPLAVIEAELSAFEARFGADMPDTFAGTVDYQHYYGATVRILWPLLAGRRIWRNLMRYPSDVMNAVAKRLVIVTSPTFLVEAADLLELDDLSANGCRMFSAGAPLPLQTATRLNSGEDWLIAEIFGSTETGAICSRTREGPDPDDAWTPLPGVLLTADDSQILVDWKTSGDAGKAEISDRGEFLADGRLRFLGRRDRIVKIREKRVSLNAIEEALLAHPLVREASAVTLERHQLNELGAVVALTEGGFEVLEEKGHRRLAEQLQHDLRSQFDPATLPKKWRFTRMLPRNGMAKVTQEALKTLFVDPTPEKMRDAFPEILADSIEATTRTIDFRVDAGLRWFRGHFPDIPVLPGVVQIDWAAHFGAPLVENAGTFSQLQRVKFGNVLQPGTKARLSLKYDAEKHSLSFVFSNSEHTFSQGRFVYA